MLISFFYSSLEYCRFPGYQSKVFSHLLWNHTRPDKRSKGPTDASHTAASELRWVTGLRSALQGGLYASKNKPYSREKRSTGCIKHKFIGLHRRPNTGLSRYSSQP